MDRPQALESPRTPSSENIASARPRRDAGTELTRWLLRLLATGLGAAIWAVAVGVILLGPREPSGLTAILLCLPAIGATALTLNGWSFLSQYHFGSYGHALKFLAFLGVAMTLIGLVPICYWTGLAALRAVGRPLL